MEKDGGGRLYFARAPALLPRMYCTIKVRFMGQQIWYSEHENQDAPDERRWKGRMDHGNKKALRGGGVPRV